MAGQTDQKLEIEQTLGIGRGRPPLWRRFWYLAPIILLVILAVYYFLGPKPKTEYVTALVEIASIDARVDATGSLEPVDKITVGAEISGRIDEVLVDFNASVRAGQVLARINTDDLRSRVVQAKAALDTARANLAQSQASDSDAQRSFGRIAALRDKGFAARSTYDTAKASADRATATVAGSQAQVDQARAALRQADTNFAKAQIKAPITGVVLDRKVEPGQTVQASFQAPELFVIASDLKTLELQVYIDEADIALVTPGQTASFTVDAYPDRTFDARVQTIRTAPRILNNVVAYLAILSVDNAHGLLRPGLTANAEIKVKSVANVLSVPNGALRFEPGEKSDGNLIPAPQIAPAATKSATQIAQKGAVYLLDANGSPVKRDVTIGISDGIKTEVKPGSLNVSERVITDAVIPAKSQR
jgi:HlyD family secretion protein